MAHTASQFRDNHVEALLRDHGYSEELDRNMIERQRREAETHREAERIEQENRGHRIRHPSAARPADH